MNLHKYIASISYQSLGIVMMFIGVGMVAIAFINLPVQLQFALGLIGLGFITLGLVQVKQELDKRKNKENIDIIVNRLDEIQQELKKVQETKGSGVVIADVISSSLKYYSEYMTRQKKEEGK